MSPLGPILRDPSVEKVFHAAEYDLQCLKRDYGFRISNLFDTMTAARLLGMRQLGLAALILNYFDVSLAKKFQRADWGKRPLSPEQIQYARMDTHYLLRLRDLLHKELEAKGRLSEACDAFERLSRIEPPNKVFDADDFWRLPGARALPAQSRTVLKELYYFREKTAAEMDKAPFRVLSEALLVRLAEKSPSSLLELENMPGMTSYLIQHFGRGLVEVILKGLASSPIEKQPARPRPTQDARTTQRYQALREWRKKKAEERELDPAAILPLEDMHKMAQAASKSEAPEAWLADLSEHKRQLYGEELRDVLRIAGPTAATPKRRRRRRR
jgi:ribonuclease D